MLHANSEGILGSHINTSKNDQRNSGSHVEVEPVGVAVRLHHPLDLLPCILRLLKAPVCLQNADSTVSYLLIFDSNNCC